MGGFGLVRNGPGTAIVGDPETVAALLEMNWGDWEGLRGVDLRADPASGFRDIEQWGWDYCPPGGESPQAVWHRVGPWVAGLTTDTVAVCHIGTMRTVLARATGWDFNGPAPFQIKRNRLYVVEVSATGLRALDAQIRLIEAKS